MSKPATVIPPPPPPVVIPPPPVVAGSNAPTSLTVTVPVGTPPPPVAAGLPGGPTTGTDPFRALMSRINGHTGTDGALSIERMKPIHAQFGASSWADYCLKARDAIPALNAVLDGMGV